METVDWWLEKPEVALEWHPFLNEEKQYFDVPRFSSRKYFWLCPTNPDHFWRTTIANRLKGGGCTVCSNRSVIPGINDLVTTHPVLASEYWSGNPVPASSVTAGSANLATWVCRRDESHIWKARLVARSRAWKDNPESGCPYCAGKVLVQGLNDFATLFPELAAQWHPTLNEGQVPSGTMPGTALKVWWLCKKDARHFWQATLNSRTGQGVGCPICTNTLVLPGVNDLVTLRPDLAREWHPTLNLPLRPESITAGANNKVWWKCLEDSTHVWKTTCNKRNVRGDGCPHCPRRPVVKVNVSFAEAAPNLVWSWDSNLNEGLSPDEVPQASGKKRYWVCQKNHSYLMSPNDRRKNGCPVCAGKRVVPGINDLQSQRPDLAYEWDNSLNSKTAEEVLVTTPARYFWVCKINRARSLPFWI